jgi:hypothetical protein
MEHIDPRKLPEMPELMIAGPGELHEEDLEVMGRQVIVASPVCTSEPMIDSIAVSLSSPCALSGILAPAANRKAAAKSVCIMIGAANSNRVYNGLLHSVPDFALECHEPRQ